MTDLNIRTEGKAGRITLTRPKALNALSYDMCVAIDAALVAWRDDPAIEIVLIDAEGEKAFCAGGDVAGLYHECQAGELENGRNFWADEYRMNARIFEYPKPVVSFLHGYVMGGGVGLGCHGSHRIVCETSKLAMPETAIGLIPDVGGTLLLALAPGRLGEYLGTTGTRMGPGDAIYAGFADCFVPAASWPALIETLCESADVTLIKAQTQPAPEGVLAPLQPQIDALFAGETDRDVINLLQSEDTEFANGCLETLQRFSPLSIAATIELVHRQRGSTTTIRTALEQEYRFTYRALEQGDFIEGVRALLIDKDKHPKWAHDFNAVPPVEVSRMLMPLGAKKLMFEEDAK